MKKFISVFFVLFLMLSLTLVGCSGSSKSGGGNKTNSSSGDTQKNGGNSKEQVTINFVHWRGEDTDAFNSIISKFEQENPSIKVSMNVMPSESYQANVQATLLSGKGADLFASFPGSQFSKLQDAGVYVDLTGEGFINNFASGLITAGQIDGKQLAIPYQLVYNIPVYNKGIFEKVGVKPPKSWEGFLEVSQKLKDAGYAPIIFDGEISSGQFINPMVMNNMPSDDSLAKIETGEEKLTNEWYIRTLDQFKQLVDKGFFEDNPLGTKKAGAAALFAQEKGAMLAQGSYMMASVKQQNPNIKQGLMAPITVPENKMKYEGIHTSTFMLGINQKSKHKEEALKFLSYLSKAEVATEYANATGQLLTIKGVNYDSPELAESAKWLEKKTLFQPRYTIKNEEVVKAITTSVEDVISGVSPQEAAKKAQEAVDRVIK